MEKLKKNSNDITKSDKKKESKPKEGIKRMSKRNNRRKLKKK